MKVIVYIDGEHNTVEVKEKIKSVLPDANYMIFNPTESIKVTNYERIKNMSVEEMAEAINKSADDGLYNLNCQKCCAYTTNGRCNKFSDDGRGGCIDGIKQWLESEVETE